ncbi:carbohydrate ABC transporter permease [Brachybacterium hainanense]|uniref:Carbohydrate ABC transporter permease n=1 Tax=Brachybacterium hainanense TaxID=1541174 RepID=A0ABV6RF00_9MICO
MTIIADDAPRTPVAPPAGSGARRTPTRPRRRLLSRRMLTAIGLSALLIPISIGWIYPFLWMLGASFKTNEDVFDGLNIFTPVLHLENYARAWQQANIGQYFLNTAVITVGSIIITVGTVALMGYALGRYRFPGRKIIIGVLAAAVFLPEGYTIIPVVDLLQTLHLADSLLGLTLASSGGAHIISLLLFAGYFAQLPDELEEAATLDGASFVRIFWRIYLPLARPVTATAIILQFMAAWNDFLLPLVMTLSKPELRTLSVGIYALQGEYGTDWSALAAASVISLLPITLLFLFLQRYFVEGIAGAVK